VNETATPGGHRASGIAAKHSKALRSFRALRGGRLASLAAWQRAPRRPGGAKQGYWGVRTHRATAP
jgi:hypothetical protein